MGINLNLLLLLLNLHKMIVKISGGHPGVKGRRIKGNVTDLLLLKGAKKLVSTAKNYLLNLHVKTNGGTGHVKLRKIWEIVISGGLNLIAKRRVDFANLSSFMKY